MGSSPTSPEVDPLDFPLCFPTLNTQWFTDLQAAINGYHGSTSAQVPPELQTLIDAAYGDIALLKSTITSQLAFLGPLQALMGAPEADLAKIVTWISDFINAVLAPMIAPIAKFNAQLMAIEGQVTATTAAIEGLASANNWTINIPGTDPFCTLGAAPSAMREAA
jgi:hypothetical protein